MAKTASRTLRTGRLYFSGVNTYAVVGLKPDGSGTPFTVYGWKEITIAEWVYAFRPKRNTDWSKFSMIGGLGNYPATLLGTGSGYNYTYTYISWTALKPDGSLKTYSYNWIDEVNKWTFFVRRFTANREISFWINAVKKYSATVPSNETTVLEYDPETSSYPRFFKRFALGSNVDFTEPMTCMYGEVRIYKRALTDAEISEIYTKGTFIKDGLVLYLPFYEGEGNIAHDVSGYGNHGTIYGAQWVVKKALRVLPKAR